MPAVPTSDPESRLVVVGAAELDLGAAALVTAVLVRLVGPAQVRGRGPLFAVWWDRNRSGLVADPVDEG